MAMENSSEDGRQFKKREKRRKEFAPLLNDEHKPAGIGRRGRRNAAERGGGRNEEAKMMDGMKKLFLLEDGAVEIPHLILGDTQQGEQGTGDNYYGTGTTGEKAANIFGVIRHWLSVLGGSGDGNCSTKS